MFSCSHTCQLPFAEWSHHNYSPAPVSATPTGIASCELLLLLLLQPRREVTLATTLRYTAVTDGYSRKDVAGGCCCFLKINWAIVTKICFVKLLLFSNLRN